MEGGRLWLSVDSTGHVEIWDEEPGLMRGGSWIGRYGGHAPLAEVDGDEASALAAVFDLVERQCVELVEKGGE